MRKTNEKREIEKQAQAERELQRRCELGGPRYMHHARKAARLERAAKEDRR